MFAWLTDSSGYTAASNREIKIAAGFLRFSGKLHAVRAVFSTEMVAIELGLRFLATFSEKTVL